MLHQRRRSHGGSGGSESNGNSGGSGASVLHNSENVLMVRRKISLQNLIYGTFSYGTFNLGTLYGLMYASMFFHNINHEHDS